MGDTRLRARSLILIFVGALVLIGLGILLSQAYRHEVAWRVSAQHQPFVARALAGATTAFKTDEAAYRRETRPVVRQRGHAICVTLATRWSHAGGSYTGCYDRRDGSFVSDHARGMPFGATRLSDRIAEWVW